MAFSQPHADAVCNFFEHILRHTADEWYGKQFVLAPWQADALIAIFGNVDEAGSRIIETAYLARSSTSNRRALFPAMS